MTVGSLPRDSQLAASARAGRDAGTPRRGTGAFGPTDHLRPAIVAGSLLCHYRARLELYQQDVAQRAGMARSVVAELELGSRPLRPHHAEALARALELSEAEREGLLTLTDRSLGARRRGPPAALDPERERAAADLYRAGWEPDAIGRVLGVHPSTARKVLARLGVPLRTAVDRQAARDRAVVAGSRRGTPVKQIARAHRMALSEVYRVLQREGVPRRRPGAGGRPPRPR